MNTRPVRCRAPLGLVVFALAGASLCAATTASASPVFETAGAALGNGGFNARVSSPSAASTYYNPALLSKAKPGFDLGWFSFYDGIQLTLNARNPAVDVPISGVDRFNSDQPPVPTEWLENGCSVELPECSFNLKARPRQGDDRTGTVRVYQSLGLVLPLIEEYVTLGLYTLIPYGPFTTGHSFYVDEREQYFSNSLHPELYGDRLDAISLAFGIGSQLTKNLSVGMSFTLSLSNQAVAGTYVGNSADIPNTLLLSTDLEVQIGVAPHFGINYTPVEGLSLSGTLHTPQKMEIVTSFGTLLPTGDEQVASATATHAWLPWTVALGGQYDFVRGPTHTFGVAAHGTFQRWSRYLNRQSERPRIDYEWEDQFTGSVGVRHDLEQKLQSYFDVTYVPSPIPEATGRDNYVDNDRFGFSGGTQYTVPLEKLGVSFKIGINGQLQFLPERSQQKVDPTTLTADYPQLVRDEWADGTKDIVTGEEIPESFGLQTNNPGYPGFSSKGLLAGLGLTLSLLF